MFLVAINIGKWSDISVYIIPDSRELSKKEFIKMLSIAVADVLVTLLGLFIIGIIPKLNKRLKKFFTLLFSW